MIDLRDQPININDEVYFIEVDNGTFHRREGIVVGFTPANVRLMAKIRWRPESTEMILKQPKYIIKK